MLCSKLAIDQFLQCNEFLTSKGYEHYEVSNYAKPGNRAKHNSSYWNGSEYIGIGPSAHSYNGHQRHWNVSSNAAYITSLKKGILPNQEEDMDKTILKNEFLMTRLRTESGIIRKEFLQLAGDKEWRVLTIASTPFINKGQMILTNNNLKCTTRGWLILDTILADLFFD